VVPTNKFVPELITTVPTPAVGPILIWVKELVSPAVPKLIVLVVPTPEAPVARLSICETVACPKVIPPVCDAPPIVTVPVVYDWAVKFCVVPVWVKVALVIVTFPPNVWVPWNVWSYQIFWNHPKLNQYFFFLFKILLL
jgi:hypothetical protein